MKKYAPTLLRIGLSLVFIWFGLNQLLNANNWLSWLPQWVFNLPIQPEIIILLNGTFETIFGTLLLFGLFTRITSLLLAAHLLGIMFNVGYNEISVRDFGLTIATISIFIQGEDRWCLDKKIRHQNLLRSVLKKIKEKEKNTNYFRKMKQKIKYLVIGIISSITLFFVFGIPTDLIPNPWFTRMIGSNILDYIFLTVSSILMGAYVGIHYYKKNKTNKCNLTVYSGGIGSFLAFGCPICNKLLVLLFGVTTLMIYLEPYRPLLGFVSISLLSGTLYWRIKND